MATHSRVEEESLVFYGEQKCAFWNWKSRAVGAAIFSRASKAASALLSWTVPKMAFRKITTKIMLASIHSPTNPEMTAANQDPDHHVCELS